MRKPLLAISILVATGTATAEYSIRQPLEAAQGGSLPNGSITFTNQQQPAPIENWIATTPLYTDWVNDGEPFNCTNWSPDPSTVALGETFTQTATDCEQQQTRTRQDREQETTTLAVRDVGFPVYENQTIAATDTRESTGTETWESFASIRSLSNDWSILSWNSKNLTRIPSSPYPQSNINMLVLEYNQLTNIDSLSNITSVDLSAFINNNQLINVDGLVNITSIGGNLFLHSNQLSSINGLSNALITQNIYVDATYSGPKLAGTTRFCSLNAASKFPAGYAQKTQLCNP